MSRTPVYYTAITTIFLIAFLINYITFNFTSLIGVILHYLVYKVSLLNWSKNTLEVIYSGKHLNMFTIIILYVLHFIFISQNCLSVILVNCRFLLLWYLVPLVACFGVVLLEIAVRSYIYYVL